MSLQNKPKITVRDALGRALGWDAAPRRVVSLVPSDTLNVSELVGVKALAGRTVYCVEPAGHVDAIQTCGGTKDVDVDAVRALAPDLILANQEENSRAQIEKLIEMGLPVYVSFPKTVQDSLAHLETLARIFCLPLDVPAIERVRAAMKDASDAPLAHELRAFIPVWMDPLMTFDGRTFAADILRWSGARNVFDDRPRRYPLAADLGLAPALDAARVGDRDTRYPRVTLKEVEARAPELVLLPDEPHPFTEQDADVFRALSMPAATRDAVIFADGKDLFWYGVRVADALPRLRALISSLRPA